MFTGIVSDVGEVVAADFAGGAARFTIACAYERQSLDPGASIACAGACQTIVAVNTLGDGRAAFDIDSSAETLACTTLGTWQAGTRVNLERSLTLSDEIGGHLVTGHVDATARITTCEENGDYRGFRLQLAGDAGRYIATKGSVALDGVSLTVNGAEDSRDGRTTTLEILLIPHTITHTTWAERRVGDRVNVEVDMMARYAERLLTVPPHRG